MWELIISSIQLQNGMLMRNMTFIPIMNGEIQLMIRWATFEDILDLIFNKTCMNIKLLTFLLHYLILIGLPLLAVGVNMAISNDLSAAYFQYIYPMYLWWLSGNIFFTIAFREIRDFGDKIMLLFILKALLVYFYAIYIRISSENIKYAVTLSLAVVGTAFWWLVEQLFFSV